MGSSYFDLCGAMPSVKSYAMMAWTDSLAPAVLSICDQPRTTRYYFAQNGDDTTGIGSQSNPFQTKAKAIALHDAGSGDMAFFFRRGDTWDEQVEFAETKGAVTISYYGDSSLPLPKFTHWEALPSPEVPWNNDSGERWVKEVDGGVAVAHVRPVSDPLYDEHPPLMRVASAAAVESTDYSWFHDTANDDLYVNLAGNDPEVLTLEINLANNLNGFSLSGDGSIIRGIYTDGWGMNPGSTSNQKMGITLLNAGATNTVAVDCDSYNCSSHCLTTYVSAGGAGVGGYNLIMGCRVGFCQYNSGGETVLNSYADNGEQQTVFRDNVIVGGTLPTSDWFSSPNTTARGSGVTVHTDGGGEVGLWVHDGNIYRNRDPIAGRPNATIYSLWGPSNLPTATLMGSPTAFRGIVRNAQTPDRLINSKDHTCLGSNFVVINSYIKVDNRTNNPAFLGGMGTISGGMNGAAINTIWDCNLESYTGSAGVFSLVNTNYSGGTPVNGYVMLHSGFVFRCGSGLAQTCADHDNYLNTTATSALAAPGPSDNAIAINCVFVKTGGPWPGYLGINNNDPFGTTGVVKNCALFGFDTSTGTVRGDNQITGRVALASAPDDLTDTIPALVGMGSSDAGVEYDFNGMLRTGTPWIGPAGPGQPWPFAPLLVFGVHPRGIYEPARGG